MNYAGDHIKNAFTVNTSQLKIAHSQHSLHSYTGGLVRSVYFFTEHAKPLNTNRYVFKMVDRPIKNLEGEEPKALPNLSKRDEDFHTVTLSSESELLIFTHWIVMGYFILELHAIFKTLVDMNLAKGAYTFSLLSCKCHDAAVVNMGQWTLLESPL